METEIETIKVDRSHKLVIRKAWNQTAWMYKVKKYQWFFLFWAAGWKEDGGYLTDVKYFETLGEAQRYVSSLRNNFLSRG